MINVSVQSLEKLDKDASNKLYMMDDSVDARYRNYLRKVLTQSKNRMPESEPKC